MIFICSISFAAAAFMCVCVPLNLSGLTINNYQYTKHNAGAVRVYGTYEPSPFDMAKENNRFKSILK